MAKTHTVKQGDHLSALAKTNGFRSFHTIFDHGNNAALKAKRDPHVLTPGDKVFIPDRTPKIENRATGARHQFVLTALKLFLRLRLMDIDNQPIKSTPCDVALVTGKPPDNIPTDGKGIVEDLIPDPLIANAEVTAHIPPKKPETVETKLKFDVRIGHLNPEFKMSGQQARLNNLGYFAGFALRDLDQFLWATEEFECDNMAKPVTKRPEIVPAPKEGEDAPTTDPDQKTGIKDAAIFNKLKDVHGI